MPPCQDTVNAATEVAVGSLGGLWEVQKAGRVTLTLQAWVSRGCWNGGRLMTADTSAGSPVWRPEVQDQGVGAVPSEGSGEDPCLPGLLGVASGPGTCGWQLHPKICFRCPGSFSPSSCKHTGPIGLGPPCSSMMSS